MSYDISLWIDTGAGNRATVYTWNFTSNCAKMWRHAGANLADFDGKPAGECGPILDAAIARMLADPDIYRAMDNASGWGTYDQLLPRLSALRDEMGHHPATTVEVYR